MNNSTNSNSQSNALTPSPFNFTESSLKNILSTSILSNEKEEAIPLITFDTMSKKFCINEQAEKFLKKLEGPLGVISVAGMYRTGKSYLLNRMLLNRSSGFSVGPTINPCTKGLWIWPKVLNGFAPDGTPLNVLIIDTEGIGATDEDQNHDNKIFTLGLLLSSYFLFNSLGAIDENALHNLSFIVNITKNIQINKSSNTSVEEISNYLPSFMWVLRDFSLKLSDTSNNAITSKDYLENSLSLQKGTSETIETKNKIRKLIKEFFRERDCVTLVRPLTDEDNLQNLAKMDQRNLRPEFLEGVSNLRKKVLHQVKPKTMNGKALNGEMFCSVMKSYVNAINTGAVPVIENAWSYMCKNECIKAMNLANGKYIETMNETVKVNFPCDLSELLNGHKEAKKVSLDFFNSVALGMYYEDYLAGLKSMIKEKKLQFKIENEKMTREKCEMFVQVNYSQIKQNLNNYLYKSFKEFKSDIEAFISYYFEKAPNGPYRSLFIYEFIIREILVHSEMFMNVLTDEIDTMIRKNKDEINNYLIKIENLKNNHINEKQQNEDSLKLQMQNEKEEYTNQIQNLNSKINEIMKEKESISKDLNEKTESLRKEYELKLADCKMQLEENDERTSDHLNNLRIKTAEWEKTKLLLEGRVKFLEKSLEEMTNKEKEILAKSLKRDSVLTYTSEKFENQVKSLNEKNEKLQEQNIDLETKLLERERRFANEKAKFEDQIENNQKQISDLNNFIKLAEEETKNLEEKLALDTNGIKVYYEEKIKEEKKFVDEVQELLRQNEDKFLQMKNKTVKEISLLKQNLELANSQIADLKTQLGESKQSYDNLMTLLEEKTHMLIDAQDKYNKTLSELNLKHTEDYNKLDLNMKEQIADLKYQLETVTNQLHDETAKLNTLSSNFITREEELKMQISQIESLNEILKTQIASLEEERNNIIKTGENNIELVQTKAKQNIETLLQKCREEIEENNARNEKSINDIRKHYEVEKESLGTKFMEASTRMTTHYNEMEESYKKQLTTLEEEKDEKIAELEETIEQLEAEYKEYYDNAERELEVKNSQIDSLNKFLNESNQNLQMIKTAHENIVHSQLEEFKSDKNRNESRSDSLMKEIISKERQNSSLITKIESLENLITSAKEEYNSILSEKKKVVSEFEEKIQLLKTENRNLQEEVLTVKTNDEKTIALKSQEIEFLTLKNTELQSYLDTALNAQEEKLKEQKAAIEADLNLLISTLTKEKGELEIKFLTKKKEYIEINNNLLKEKNMLEKDREVLIEKLTSANNMKTELSLALENERKNFESKLQSSKNEARKELELVIKDNEMMKGKMKALEGRYSEVSANYEKDIELWSTKFKFLEEQKAQARSDLAECQRKFESGLDNLTRKGVLEKDKMENMQTALVSSLELKYKSHVRELQETFAQKLENANRRRKEIEQENKLLIEKLKDKEERKPLSELEKKVAVYEENESKLKNEIYKLTEENLTKMSEMNKTVKLMKENCDAKIVTLEDKLREYERGRSDLAVNSLKDKALMDKDKQNMQHEIEKLNEKIKEFSKEGRKLQDENKRLIRENEKLKKGSKFSSKDNSIFVPKYLKYMSANKENMRTNSNTSFEVRALDMLSPRLNINSNKSDESVDLPDDDKDEEMTKDNIRNTEILI